MARQDPPRDDGIDRGGDGRPPVPMVGVDSSQYGVPRVVTRQVDDWTRDDQTLFRGDGRSPDEIRSDGGFLPPYMTREGWENDPSAATPDIRQHVGGHTNAFVSTSTDRDVAQSFAISQYVYEINAPGGIYTDPTLHPVTGKETHGEGEVLFPGGINWGYVRGWYQMRYEPGTGFVAGDFVPNPDYIGDRTPSTTDTSSATSTDPTGQTTPPRQDTHQPSQPDQRGQEGTQPGQQPAHPSQQPDRPGQQTNRPGQPMDQPGQRPDQPGQRSDSSGQRADQSSQRPDQSGHRPDQTGHRPDSFSQRPDQPGQPTDQSGQRPDQPGQHSDRPAQYGPSTQDATRPGEPSRHDTSPVTEHRAGDRPASLGDRMGRLDDPALDSLRPHLRSTEGGMSAFAPPSDSSDPRQRYDHQNELYTANQVPRIPGQFVVDMHGSADSVRVGDTPLTPRQLADLIRANPDYDGGPVSLLGCGTGSRPDGFAAQLAQELGVPVTAPSRDAWVDHNGNVFASSQAFNADTSKPARPTWPPNGEWNTYSPNGDQTVHRGPYPPGHTPTWAGDTPSRPPIAARRGDEPETQPDDRPQDRPASPAPSVDAARQAAALTRTDTGDVDPDAVADLLNGLPSLPDDSPDSIRAMVATVYDGDVTLEPVGGRDGRVRTERPVYRVMVDGEPVGYVKVVPDGSEFAAELSAADRLDQAELTSFGVPDVLAVASVPDPDGTPRGALFSTAAPGDSVDGLLRRVPLAWDRDRAMDDLRQAVTGVAEGMAELHRGSDRPASPSYLTPHADAIRDHLDELETRRETLERLGIDLDQIRAAMDSTIADAMADPGPAGLTHGDAHLGNFLWDADAGVSLIDAPTLHQSMDAAGAPIGTPARDVTLFNQRIGHFGFEFGLSPAQISQLRSDFADAYTRNGGPAVPRPVQAMFDARAATHRLTRAVTRLEERPDPRRAADVGAATAALQDALNLDNTAATELANGFAGELPGTPEFRRAWTAIDNFRSYMANTADPAIRERFEAEYADRIRELQSRQTAEFKNLWKHLFPSKKDEFALSPEGSRRADELIREQVAEAENLMNELSRFAATTGDPALAEGNAASTMDREGTAAWEASFRETQAKINEVLANPAFRYHGHEIGYIGSMKSGMRGAHKGKTRFDPYDFDVDLYVVVDQETYDAIRTAYPHLDSDDTKLMPSDEEPEDLVELSEQIGQALKAAFPHVRGIEESVIALRVEQPW